jgi:hypothetical protein
VESVENQTQVFHAFHRPLKIPQQRRDFHISTAPTTMANIFSEPKNRRKEVGRSTASTFSLAHTRSFKSRSTFMLILQLENAPGSWLG